MLILIVLNSKTITFHVQYVHSNLIFLLIIYFNNKKMYELIGN